MACLKLSGNLARGLGDNFQTTHDCIRRASISLKIMEGQAVDKAARELDIIDDVLQCSSD
jgi:hypothetical protein